MKKCALLLLLCALLTGCAALPGEERSYVLTLGVGVHDGTWLAVAQLPDYKGEGGYHVLSATGQTLREALAALDARAPSRLHFGQLRLLVTDEETARGEQFSMLLQGAARLKDVRMRAQLFVTADDLTELVSGLQPESGSRLSKYLDVLLRARTEEGLLPGTTLSDWRLSGGRRDPVLGAVALEKAQEGAPGLDAAGGTLSGTGAGTVRFGGGWVVGTDGRVNSRLTLRDMQLLSLAAGRPVTAAYQAEGVSAKLRSVSARWTLVSATAELRLSLWADMEHGAPTALRPALEKDLTELLEKICHSPSDPFGLTGQAVRQGQDAASFRQGLPAMAVRVTVAVGQ